MNYYLMSHGINYHKKTHGIPQIFFFKTIIKKSCDVKNIQVPTYFIEKKIIIDEMMHGCITITKDCSLRMWAIRVAQMTICKNYHKKHKA